MDRRKFLLSSLASIPALVVKPDLLRTHDAPLSPVLADKIDPILASKIRDFEARIAANPGTFNWAAHNELRHLYLSIDEYKAMVHADTILAHSVMDSYILNTLSDWYIEKDPPMAAAILLGRAQRHQSLFHLVAASLITVGDLIDAHIGKSKGNPFFEGVISLGRQSVIPTVSWKQYELLATMRLQS